VTSKLPQTTNSLDPANAGDAAVLVALTRMEAKVDIALAQHGAEIKTQGQTVEDHEARIRVLESRSTVSPRTLWTVVAGGAGLAISAISLIQNLFN